MTMAASSTAAWTWAMNATAIASSSSSSSSSHTFQCRYRNTHVAKLSLDDSNSSSSSSASSSSEPISGRHRNRSKGSLNCPPAIPNLDSLTRKRPTPLGKSADGSYSVLGADGSGGASPESAIQPIRQLGLWKRSGLKLFFGKRPLWKRIFFASKKVRSIILLNVLTIIYASDIPVIKEVEEIMDPALFTVVRFTLSAIPFIPFMLQARGDGRTRAAGMELGLWVSLGYIMQALALLTSDAGRASFISAFTVITVPFIDGIFGATVPSLTWFGAVITLVGVGMLESSGSPPCVGDILNFFSAVFFGIHMLRTEHISRVTSKEKFLSLLGFEVSVIALLSIAWYFVMGGFGDLYRLLSTSWSWMEVQDFLISFPWIPALYTGIFSTGLCLWVEMAAMRDVSATETSIIYGLEPLWGAGFAWFLLGERWGIAGWIGAVLVLTGSLTVQIFGSLPEKTNEEEASVPCDQLQSISKQDISVVPVIVNSTKNFIKQLKNE